MPTTRPKSRGKGSGRSSLDAPLPARWGPGQRLKNSLIYALVRCAVALLPLLPRTLLRALGTTLGWLAGLVALSERAKAERHLAIAFPDRTPAWRRRVARRMFVRLGRAAADMLALRRLLKRGSGFALEPEHVEVFRDALAQGKGAIAVSGHVGNWELCAQAIAHAGLPIASIASPTYDPRLTRLIDEHRCQFGMDVLWRGDSRVSKEMLRVFRKNAILGLLIDQDTNVQGAYVPFFGKLAHTPVAAASLALRFRCPIVVGFAVHDGRAYRLVYEAFPYDSEESVESLTARLTARIEQEIRKDPSQWVWLHRRWKTQALASDEPIPEKEIAPDDV